VRLPAGDGGLHRLVNGTRLHSALGYLTPNEFETAGRGEAVEKVA